VTGTKCLALVLLVLPAILIAACDGGGDDVSPAIGPTSTASSAFPSAEPTATAELSVTPESGTPPTELSPTPMETTMPASLSLSSPAFTDGSPIPRRFTCDGTNVSPTLIWEGAPDGTATLALIVDDPDAPGGTFVHWVAYDMDGAPEGGLAEGVSGTSGAPREGRNDFGRAGYGGPCPPSGTHHYRFQLYALDLRLGLGGTPSADQLRLAMEGHVLADTVLVGTYRR
jgi:Raf kinase inhibitor-like YbhB/YbcL family protein